MAETHVSVRPSIAHEPYRYRVDEGWTSDIRLYRINLAIEALHIWVVSMADNLALIVIALIVTFSLIGCSGEATTGDTPSPLPPTATQGQRLGGLHLDAYCNSQRFAKATPSNGTWACKRDNKQGEGYDQGELDLTKACQWQYSSATNVTAKQERASDPYSWACYGQQT